MKLSQMSTEQGFDALLAIAPEIQPILADAEIMGELKKVASGGKDKTQAGLAVMMTLTRMLFGKHRQATCRVLGALNGKNENEVLEQGLLETVRQVWEIFRDKELLDFFMSLKSGGLGK